MTSYLLSVNVTHANEKKQKRQIIQHVKTGCTKLRSEIETKRNILKCETKQNILKCETQRNKLKCKTKRKYTKIQ